MKGATIWLFDEYRIQHREHWCWSTLEREARKWLLEEDAEPQRGAATFGAQRSAIHGGGMFADVAIMFFHEGARITRRAFIGAGITAGGATR